MSMMLRLNQELREVERGLEKKANEKLEARYESLMMAKAGWEALCAWIEMPGQGQRSSGGQQLASVGLSLAESQGFKEDVLAASALSAMRGDKKEAFEWLLEQGFDPKAAPAPRLARGGFFERWTRQGEPNALGWLAAAAHSSAFGCARVMADHGCFERPTAPEKATAKKPTPSRSASKPASGRVKKQAEGAGDTLGDAETAELLELYESQLIESANSSMLENEVRRMQESHPLFLVLSGRVDLAPPGIEQELLEPRFGLEMSADSPVFRLALAREASKGQPRVIALASKMGIGPLEGAGAAAAATLEKCADFLIWSSVSEGGSKRETREIRAADSHMRVWIKSSGALKSLAEKQTPFSDYMLGDLIERMERCFDSGSPKSALMAMSGVRRSAAAIFSPKALAEKNTMGAPSEAALISAQTRLDACLLDDHFKRYSSDEDKKSYESLRLITQKWSQELADLRADPAPKRPTLRV